MAKKNKKQRPRHCHKCRGTDPDANHRYTCGNEPEKERVFDE